MRYRRLDANGDMQFGHGQADFLINSPECVAQWVMTRLRLGLGEWFADLREGTPWATQVLGERTQQTRDVVVLGRVQTTGGVLGVLGYVSSQDPDTRTWSAAMSVNTVYGAVQLAMGAMGALPGVAGEAAPFMPSQWLSVTGPEVTSSPAAMDASLHPNIYNFMIQALDAGEY